MGYLILGLVLFLGVHSVRIVANGWRMRWIGRVGEGAYKGLYSAISLVGFILVVWGFGVARETPVMWWSPPLGMRHAVAWFTLPAFVLLSAAYVPGNAIKARLHHPMVLGVIMWALAHLLANASVAHLVLFGAFLIWGVADLVSALQRDGEAGTVYPSGNTKATVVTVLMGVLAWALFAFALHGLLIGIKPVA